MSAFISPRIDVPFSFENVTFQLRPLTGAKYLEIVMASSSEKETIEFSHRALEIAIKNGLVGWNGSNTPSWDPRNMQNNIDQLSMEAYVAISKKVIDITVLPEHEKKT